MLYMQQALNEAKQAAMEGEVPIGAVLVYEAQIIAKAHNSVIRDSDATAHAEMKVLRQGFLHFKNYRFPKGVSLYSTLEPCPMCAGAILHARVSEVIFALSDPRGGAAGSVVQLLQDLRFNHVVRIQKGVLEAEARAELQTFFASRR